MVRLATVIALFLLCSSSFAQGNKELDMLRPNPYEPRFSQADGYIILLNGDTLRGQINRSPDFLEIQEKVGFRDSTNAPYRYYRSTQLRGYGLADFHFEAVVRPEPNSSKFDEDNAIFLWRKLEGEMSCYIYLFYNEESTALVPIEPRHILSHPNGSYFNPGPIIGFRFWKRLATFVNNCETLMEEIEEKVYTKDDLETIALRYNTSCLDSSSQGRLE